MKVLRVFIVILFCLGSISIFILNQYVGAGEGGVLNIYEADNIENINLTTQIDSFVSSNSNYILLNSDIYFSEILIKSGYKPNEVLLQDLLNIYKESKYLLIRDVNLVFEYKYYIKDDGFIKLMLVSANNKGEILQMAKNINYFKRKKYCTIFEKKFISKLIAFN